MFARVAVYDIAGHRMEEAVTAFRDAIDEISALSPREVMVLVSPENDQALTMSLWEHHDAMEQSRVAASRVRSTAAGLVDGTVRSVVEFEVALHERSES